MRLGFRSFVVLCVGALAALLVFIVVVPNYYRSDNSVVGAFNSAVVTAASTSTRFHNLLIAFAEAQLRDVVGAVNESLDAAEAGESSFGAGSCSTEPPRGVVRRHTAGHPFDGFALPESVWCLSGCVNRTWGGNATHMWYEELSAPTVRFRTTLSNMHTCVIPQESVGRWLRQHANLLVPPDPTLRVIACVAYSDVGRRCVSSNNNSDLESLQYGTPDSNFTEVLAALPNGNVFRGIVARSNLSDGSIVVDVAVLRAVAYDVSHHAAKYGHQERLEYWTISVTVVVGSFLVCFLFASLVLHRFRTAVFNAGSVVQILRPPTPVLGSPDQVLSDAGGPSDADGGPSTTLSVSHSTSRRRRNVSGSQPSGRGGAFTRTSIGGGQTLSTEEDASEHTTERVGKFQVTVTSRERGLNELRCTVVFVRMMKLPEVAFSDVVEAERISGDFLSDVTVIAKQTNGSVLHVTAVGALVAWNALVPVVSHENAAILFCELIAPKLDASCCSCISVTSGTVYTTKSLNPPIAFGEAIDSAIAQNQLQLLHHVPIAVTEEVVFKVSARIGWLAYPFDVVSFGQESEAECVLYELKLHAPLPKEQAEKLIALLRSFFSALHQLQFHECIHLLGELGDQTRAARLFALCQHLQSPDVFAGLKRKGRYCRQQPMWTTLADPQTTKEALADRMKRVVTNVTSPSNDANGDNGCVDNEGPAEQQPDMSRCEMEKVEPQTAPRATTPRALASAIPTTYDPYEHLPEFFLDQKGRKWSRSDKCLGTGHNGSRVFLGMSYDGVPVAIKCVDLSELNEMQRECEFNAAVVTASLCHRHVVGVQFVTNCNNHYLLTVMQHLSGGKLTSILHDVGSLPLKTAQQYARDVLEGVRYLQQAGVAHCCLNPDTVSLTMEGTCKVTTLTFAEVFGKPRSSLAGAQCTAQMLISRGFSRYIAPEVLEGKPHANSDIYSFGVIVAAMVLGLGRVEREDLLHSEGQGLFAVEALPVPLQADTNAASKVASFITPCLSRSPDARPTADQLLYHPFFM